MKTDKDELIILLKQCIINEELAAENFRKLMVLTKDERIKEYIDTENRHIQILEEIISKTQQI